MKWAIAKSLKWQHWVAISVFMVCATALAITGTVSPQQLANFIRSLL